MVVTKHVVDVVTNANHEADRKVLLASGPRPAMGEYASNTSVDRQPRRTWLRGLSLIAIRNPEPMANSKLDRAKVSGLP